MTAAANGVAGAASRGAAGGEVPAAVLRRVCGLLDECAIPFQLTGDVAAAAYGAARPIRSVELFIAAEHVPALLRGAAEHVVDYPWRRRDDAWDRVALSLSFDGVTIDVCIAEAARFREPATGSWRDAAIDPRGVRHRAGPGRGGAGDAARSAPGPEAETQPGDRPTRRPRHHGIESVTNHPRLSGVRGVVVDSDEYDRPPSTTRRRQGTVHMPMRYDIRPASLGVPAFAML